MCLPIQYSPSAGRFLAATNPKATQVLQAQIGDEHMILGSVASKSPDRLSLVVPRQDRKLNPDFDFFSEVRLKLEKQTQF